MTRSRLPVPMELVGAIWAAAMLGFLGYLATSHSTQIWTLLTLRHNQAVAVTQELEGALRTVEGLPRLLAGSARDASNNGSLNARRLADLRAEGQPFCRLYWLDPQGRPRLPGDPAPPAWLWSLAARRPSEDVAILRPLPPGLEAGRFTPEQVRLEEDTLELYLAAVVRAKDGDVLVAELDLAFVFGPWLKKRLERSPLGADLTGAALPDGSPNMAQAPPEPQQDAQGFAGHSDDQVWSWRVPTFFAASDHPFRPLQLTLANQAAIGELARSKSRTSLGVVVLMLAFGWVLRANGLAMRRQREYTEARALFTQMVSHELRTPLAAISMYSEILREGMVEDPEKIAVYHEQLASQTERLKKLVEDVLTFGRLEGHEPAPRWQPVRLAELVEQTRQSLLVWEARVPAPAGVQVHPIGPECDLESDPDLLSLILTNLVVNAVKYGGTGAPIEISARPESDRVVLEVADRGPGVSEAEKREIFKPYTRAWKGEGPKKEGLGLGLAVVDRLTRALRGSVACLDRPGGGSIFAVTLPRKAA